MGFFHCIYNIHIDAITKNTKLNVGDNSKDSTIEKSLFSHFTENSVNCSSSQLHLLRVSLLETNVNSYSAVIRNNF